MLLHQGPQLLQLRVQSGGFLQVSLNAEEVARLGLAEEGAQHVGGIGAVSASVVGEAIFLHPGVVVWGSAPFSTTTFISWSVAVLAACTLGWSKGLMRSTALATAVATSHGKTPGPGPTHRAVGW
jgi:hypothetical protein